MNLISIDNISKGLGEKILFEKVSFGLDEGDKVALIGNNGTGKTTLLRILAGKEEVDGGNISRNNELSLSYLEQIPIFDPEHTILEHVLSDNSPKMKVIKDYERCLEEIKEGQNKDHELARLTDRMEQLDAWNLESDIKSILTELGLEDPLLKMGNLSGGMIKKVSLAQTLVRDANLIFLDEPTNHLDIDTICWLQDYLLKTKKGVILVTHDRYFLDTICKRIFEIQDERLLRYDGNYSYYLEKKSEREQALVKEQDKIKVVLRRELEWLKRGPRARAGKSRARTNRVINLMESRAGKVEESKDFSVNQRRLGKKILVLKEISKSYGDKKVVLPFSYTFSKGERIGLVGPNGSGKSTFLKMVTSSLEPDSGELELGINTHFGYFDQLSEAMDKDLTILEYLKEEAEYIKMADGSTLGVSLLLEQFSFNRDKFNTPVQYLSGGEKRRLYLIKVLLSSPNFLVFDEPTNDFDIKTLSMLEDFLSRFPGCLMVVSHDRYFLDRTVDYLFIFDGKGNIFGFGGDYSAYLEYKKEETEIAKQALAASLPKPGKVRKEEPKKKLSFKEQKELDDLWEAIESLETEKKELEVWFSTPDQNPEELKSKQDRYNQMDDLLMEKMERWEELAARSS